MSDWGVDIVWAVVVTFALGIIAAIVYFVIVNKDKRAVRVGLIAVVAVIVLTFVHRCVVRPSGGGDYAGQYPE